MGKKGVWNKASQKIKDLNHSGGSSTMGSLNSSAYHFRRSLNWRGKKIQWMNPLITTKRLIVGYDYVSVSPGTDTYRLRIHVSRYKAEWLSHSFPHSRQRRDDLILDSPGRDFKYSDSSDAMGSTSLSKSAPLRPSQRQRRDRSCFTLVLIVHSNITIFVLFKTSILLHLLFTLSQVYIWVLQSILLFQADLVGSFGMNLQMLN